MEESILRRYVKLRKTNWLLFILTLVITVGTILLVLAVLSVIGMFLYKKKKVEETRSNPMYHRTLSERNAIRDAEKYVESARLAYDSTVNRITAIKSDIQTEYTPDLLKKLRRAERKEKREREILRRNKKDLNRLNRGLSVSSRFKRRMREKREIRVRRERKRRSPL